MRAINLSYKFFPVYFVIDTKRWDTFDDLKSDRLSQ